MDLGGKGQGAGALPGVRPFSRVTARILGRNTLILGKGHTAYTPPSLTNGPTPHLAGMQN